MIKKNEILKSKILIVDDDEDDVMLTKDILTEAGYTSVDSTLTPEVAPALHAETNYDLILLDLLMPGMDGFAVMEKLKTVETEGYLPVFVITGGPDMKARALQAGAKDFVAKPVDPTELLSRVHNMLEVRLLYKKLHERNAALEASVRERTADLKQTYLETVVAMTRAAEYKDENTGDHLERIGFFCKETANLLGCDADFADRMFFASPMHDIGKISVPDHILLKPAALTPDEWEIMKGHTTLGAKILGNCRAPYLRTGAEIAQNHHERWDGSGYPNGLIETAIPLSARIMHLCDIYDALRCKRPYKPPLAHETAVEIITKGDGRTMPGHFDPVVLDAFERHSGRYRELFSEFGKCGEIAEESGKGNE
jgi:putative two-component system response regulator